MVIGADGVAPWGKDELGRRSGAVAGTDGVLACGWDPEEVTSCETTPWCEAFSSEGASALVADDSFSDVA